MQSLGMGAVPRISLRLVRLPHLQCHPSIFARGRRGSVKPATILVGQRKWVQRVSVPLQVTLRPTVHASFDTWGVERRNDGDAH